MTILRRMERERKRLGSPELRGIMRDPVSLHALATGVNRAVTGMEQLLSSVENRTRLSFASHLLRDLGNPPQDMEIEADYMQARIQVLNMMHFGISESGTLLHRERELYREFKELPEDMQGKIKSFTDFFQDESGEADGLKKALKFWDALVAELPRNRRGKGLPPALRFGFGRNDETIHIWMQTGRVPEPTVMSRFLEINVEDPEAREEILKLYSQIPKTSYIRSQRDRF